MYFRTFFFILFILTATLFLVSSFQPLLIEDFFKIFWQDKRLVEYIQLSSMFASSISIILFIVTSYYAKKHFIMAQKKLELERKNIEEIHSELEALKKQKNSLTEK